jgi:hypothetical protein
MQHSKRNPLGTPRAWLSAAAACAVAGVALAAAPAEPEAAQTARGETELARGSLEAVDSFYLYGGPQRWSIVDDDTVIVWATSFRPYLIDLAFRSPDLEFADRIALTSLEHRVYAKFDAVRVAGMRYPIEGIYKLTPEEAKAHEAS